MKGRMGKEKMFIGQYSLGNPVGQVKIDVFIRNRVAQAVGFEKQKQEGQKENCSPAEYGPMFIHYRRNAIS